MYVHNCLYPFIGIQFGAHWYSCCYGFIHCCSKHQTKYRISRSIQVRRDVLLYVVRIITYLNYVIMMYLCVLRMHPIRYFTKYSGATMTDITWVAGTVCSSDRGVGRRTEFATGTFPRTPSTASIIFRKRTDGGRAQVDLFLFFLRQYKITDRYALLVVISENN